MENKVVWLFLSKIYADSRVRVGCSGADGRYQPSAPLRWFRGWQLSGECINTSVLRCLDHFITSPDTAVYWILCVNFWYYRFPCSLDRQIPTEIIIFDFFPFQLNKLKKTESLSTYVGFWPSGVVMLQPDCRVERPFPLSFMTFCFVIFILKVEHNNFRITKTYVFREIIQVFLLFCFGTEKC